MKKKNYLWILVLILGLLPVLSGCSSEAAPLDPGSAGTLYGNTAANLLNGGYMVEGNDGYVYSFSGELGEIDLVRIRDGQAETLTRIPGEITSIYAMNYWDQALYFIAEDTSECSLYCYHLDENNLVRLRNGAFTELIVYDGVLITEEISDDDQIIQINQYNLDMTERTKIYTDKSLRYADEISKDYTAVYLQNETLYFCVDTRKVNTIRRFDAKNEYEEIDPVELDLILLNEGVDQKLWLGVPYGDYLFGYYFDSDKYAGYRYQNIPASLFAVNLDTEETLLLGEIEQVDGINVYNDELYIYAGNANTGNYYKPGTLYRIQISDKIDDIQTVFEDNLMERETQSGVKAHVMNKGLFTTSQGLYFESNIQNFSVGETHIYNKLLSTYETSMFNPDTNDLVLVDNVFGIDRVTE